MRRIARVLLVTAYLAALYAILSSYAPGSLRLDVDATELTACITLLAASEFIRGARLALLYKSIDRETSIARCIVARFIGNVFAVLTPSIAGGEVARGVALHGKIESKAVTAVAIAAVDGGLDLVSNYLLAVILWVIGVSLTSPLPEAIASPGFAAWIIGLLLVSSGGVPRAIDKIAGMLGSHRLGSMLVKHLENVRRLHVPAWRVILAFALSAVAWLLMGLSYAIVSNLTVLRAEACVVELYLYGVIPVPGGVGPGEAILSSECPGIAAWKGLALLTAVVPGLILLIARSM